MKLLEISNLLKENKNNYEVIRKMLDEEVVKTTLEVTYKGNFNDLAEWNAFHNPSNLNKIVNKMSEYINWNEIDYIAALGASGTPLAVGLSLINDKKFIFINDRWGITKKFQPIKPNDVEIEGKKILLIDSVFRTGLTAYNGIKIIKEHSGYPELMVIAILEDWIDISILNELKDIEFYYLFNWGEEVEKVAKERKVI